MLWWLNKPCTFCSLFFLPYSFPFSRSSLMPSFSDLCVCFLSQALCIHTFIFFTTNARTHWHISSHSNPWGIPSTCSTLPTLTAFQSTPNPSPPNRCVHNFLLRNLLFYSTGAPRIHLSTTYILYNIKLVGILTVSSKQEDFLHDVDGDF